MIIINLLFLIMFTVASIIGAINAAYYKKIVNGNRFLNNVFAIFGIGTIVVLIYVFKQVYSLISAEFKFWTIFISILIYLFSFVFLSKLLK